MSRYNLSSREFLAEAEKAVCDYVCMDTRKDFLDICKGITTVWFSHVLGNKKAIITVLGTNKMYEVTYNSCEGKMYLDVYSKDTNIVINLEGDDQIV